MSVDTKTMFIVTNKHLVFNLKPILFSMLKPRKFMNVIKKHQGGCLLGTQVIEGKEKQKFVRIYMESRLFKLSKLIFHEATASSNKIKLPALI